jgi:hypothetical protein
MEMILSSETSVHINDSLCMSQKIEAFDDLHIISIWIGNCFSHKSPWNYMKSFRDEGHIIGIHTSTHWSADEVNLMCVTCVKYTRKEYP